MRDHIFIYSPVKNILLIHMLSLGRRCHTNGEDVIYNVDRHKNMALHTGITDVYLV